MDQCFKLISPLNTPPPMMLRTSCDAILYARTPWRVPGMVHDVSKVLRNFIRRLMLQPKMVRNSELHQLDACLHMYKPHQCDRGCCILHGLRERTCMRHHDQQIRPEYWPMATCKGQQPTAYETTVNCEIPWKLKNIARCQTNDESLFCWTLRTSIG